MFDSFRGVRPYKIWDGAVARAVAGERLQLALIDIEPNRTVPQHHHPNEQVGFVIEGSITMTIGGEARELRAGETYVIPGEVPHSAESGPEGCVVIDTFSPPRADWESLERMGESPGRWPK